MSSKIKVLCGVPEAYCTGGKLSTDQQFKTHKCHGSRSDAHKCMRNYLINVLKYKPIGQREFLPPDGGPIRLLPKKSKFGGRLRTGKELTRYMPEDDNGQSNRGLIF